MNKVYVLGGAQTDFERNWTKEGKNVIGLLREVLTDGFQDVGLDFDEIRRLNKKNKVACFVGNFIAEKYIEQGHLGSLLTEVDEAFYGVPSARYEAACASGSVALDAGITKIKTGEYDLAVVVGWELMKTVDAKVGGDFLGRAAYYEKEAKGIEFPFPKLFGKLADSTLEKYPIDEKRYLNALAMISCKNYSNAKNNQNAQTRKWYMDYEQAANRGTETNPYIGGKLAISDCSQVTDGAAVVLLASEKYMKKLGAKAPIIKGYGHRVAPLQFTDKIAESRENLYILPWTRQTVEDCYRRAHLTVDDIDIFETHDCFTSSEYAAISSFGITAPGEEYRAVEEGWIMHDGRKPINPSGGLIGGGHPVGATGVRMFLDIYKQVAQRAGEYQILNAQNALMLNLGGSATTNYAFLVGNDSGL
ncbi:thiolase domain-containing protein [Clostridium sp. AF19-22AC]|jgi:acetyl-CoA C-acetyltransferase|uniref:acetyl-CoA acetyltransferase n=1 Tax=Clostridia TaxID=186801 RepID=UPI000E4FF10B|nr:MULTISPECIES: acetyl-CoA acetyltransferase [Clostridia]RHR31839.1 thiolase domain-containing protein [Clostridium sp. AF19-22AC]